MALGDWRRIPGTAPATVRIGVQTYPAIGNTGPQSKIIAWCGLALDPRDSTVYMPAGGGHNDYAGNEVDSIKLSDDAPAWIERRASTPVAQITRNSNHYLDGRPTSRHSYYGVTFSQQRNRAMTFGGVCWGDGSSISSCDGFNPATNDWDPANTYPNAPQLAHPAAAVTADEKTGDVYTFLHFSVFCWNAASNTWRTLIDGTSPVYGDEAATACDTRRNRILIIGGLASEHYFYDIGTGAVQAVSFTGLAGQAMSNGNGLVYVPALDAYLLRTDDAGATIYRIDAQTLNVDIPPTRGGDSVTAAFNHVYRRFLYAPQLGGVVYSPDYNSDLWFLRTS